MKKVKTGSSDSSKDLHSWLAFNTIKSSVFKKMESFIEVIEVVGGGSVSASGVVGGGSVPASEVVGGGSVPASGVVGGGSLPTSEVVGGGPVPASGIDDSGYRW